MTNTITDKKCIIITYSKHIQIVKIDIYVKKSKLPLLLYDNVFDFVVVELSSLVVFVFIGIDIASPKPVIISEMTTTNEVTMRMTLTFSFILQNAWLF